MKYRSCFFTLVALFYAQLNAQSMLRVDGSTQGISLHSKSSRDSLEIQPKNQIDLNAGVLFASIGYARRTTGYWFLGFSVGIGFDYLNHVIVAGDHFSDSGSFLDVNNSEDLIEVLQASLYRRYQKSSHWSLDFGVRASIFVHHGYHDGEIGYFVGGYTSAMVGWRKLKIGSRISLGGFLEGPNQEFGIYVTPLIVTVSIPW